MTALIDRNFPDFLNLVMNPFQPGELTQGLSPLASVTRHIFAMNAAGRLLQAARDFTDLQSTDSETGLGGGHISAEAG